MLKPVKDYLDALVHSSAQTDALTASRHRAFIAPRLLGSFTALAALPIYLTLRGAPTLLEIAVFGWLIAPILIAYFLSRTGRYEGAHILSSLALTFLVTAVAFKTGGIGSFAAIWLVIVPLEAALSASRRVVALASTFALCAAGLLAAASFNGWLPIADMPGAEHGALAALGIVSAALYATGLALGAESLARTSFWLLYAEEDRYRLLARNMTDVITRHDANGAVLFTSPAAESLFGVGKDELLGHRLFDRVHVADRPAYLTALSQSAARGDAGSVEFRFRRDGQMNGVPVVEFVWIEMRCRPLDKVSGELASACEVVTVMRDISGRKTQEQALETARAESERASASKTRFMATMSHELRTPLNAIIGFSDMLAKEELLNLNAARRGEYSRLINDSGQHLLAVVNGILDMSRIETGDFEIMPEPFALGKVIEGCCDLLALRARESDVQLQIALAPDLPDLVADKRAIKQVLINLVSNALKFTNAGGQVTIAARADGATIVVTVEDNGVGISADDLPRLGDPFFQGRSTYDRRHEGTGLGLSIVKGLVALHHGTLDLKSTLGKGTRVTVRLPVDCEKYLKPNPPVSREPAPRAAVISLVKKSA